MNGDLPPIAGRVAVAPPNMANAKLSVCCASARPRRGFDLPARDARQRRGLQSDAAVRTIEELLCEPGLAHYIFGWPVEDDVGVVAEANRRLGAAWWRFFYSSDPGYGLINGSTHGSITLNVRSAPPLRLKFLRR